LALAGALPALLTAGLALRPPQAPDARVNDRLTFALPNGTEMVVEARDLWGNAVNAPDPLIYWSGTPAQSVAGARFLASLGRARRTMVPLPASGGYLLLYSLAYRQVLASAPSPKEMR
jgi:hypothetical protein